MKLSVRLERVLHKCLVAFASAMLVLGLSLLPIVGDSSARAQEPPPAQVDCDPLPDRDGDGVFASECGGADCDDNDGNRYPGNTELCNGRDEDCDPDTGGFQDSDGDGHADWSCH